MGEEVAAVVLMVLIVISLVVSWASLMRRRERPVSDSSYEHYSSRIVSQMVKEPQRLSARQIMRQQSPSRQGKRHVESSMTKQAMTGEQGLRQAPSTEDGSSGPEATSHSTSAGGQSTAGRREVPRSNEAGRGPVSVGEGEQSPDLENLESMLTETKKLFAVLLEEYERLKELIE